MENVNTELSGKTPAFISWMQIAGLVLFLTSRLSFLRHLAWLFYAGIALILIAYAIRMYFHWKQGNKKAFQRGLVILLIALVAGLLTGYLTTRNS